MKALVKSHPREGIWLSEEEVPSPGPNDLLIRIRKTAICGTDIHIFNWDDWAQKTIPVPMITGHEFVGDVVAVGSHVQGFEVGQRVSGEGHVTCGYCRNCRAGRRHLCRNTVGIGVNRTGAFAEYLCLPAVNAFKIPPSIPDSIASILDPLGNATHAALSFDLVGEDVLITGAGPIGLMAVAICRHVGARNVVITDINPYRLELATKMGATMAIDVRHESIADAQASIGMSEGFDVGLEMSGNPHGLRDTLDNLNHGGRLAILGIPPSETTIDWNQVVFKGLTLKGIYGREMFETWYKMLSMLQSGLDISPILTHELPISDYADGFHIMKSGLCGKVVLNWTEEHQPEEL
ncbi:MAG: L-threonine 3-dehydrogenase [Myxococcota bacterium]